MNTTETTAKVTTYTSPETGVVIDAQDLAGEYGQQESLPVRVDPADPARERRAMEPDGRGFVRR